MEYNTSNKTKDLSASGWEYTHTDSSRGSWIDNGRNHVAAENSDYRKREVKSTYVDPTYKTQYRYGRWTNGVDRAFCPNWGSQEYGGTFYKTYTQWYDSEVHTYNWNSSKNRPYMYYCAGKNHNHYKYVNNVSVYEIDNLLEVHQQKSVISKTVESECIDHCIGIKEKKLNGYKILNPEIEEYWLGIYFPLSSERYFEHLEGYKCRDTEYSRVYLLEHNQKMQVK
jgi:hypothetical protein